MFFNGFIWPVRKSDINYINNKIYRSVKTSLGYLIVCFGILSDMSIQFQLVFSFFLFLD